MAKLIINQLQAQSPIPESTVLLKIWWERSAVQSSDVTIFFNGYTLTTTSSGIQSIGNNTVSIEGGTIMSGNPALDIESGIDIQVFNMTFTSNKIGINFNNIQDFLINNCQFTNYTGNSITVSNSNNGDITSCQIHNNNTANLIASLNLINTTSCNQLLLNNIVMTENSNTTTLIGVNAISTNNSTFSNLQINSNQVNSFFEGIYLQDSNNNNIQTCNINNNTVSSSSSGVYVSVLK